MAKNTSVSLGDHFTQFVEHQVNAGRYGSATDVMRAGLRLLEEHEAKLAVLKQAWADGIASGDAGPLDFAELRQAAQAKLAAERKG